MTETIKKTVKMEKNDVVCTSEQREKKQKKDKKSKKADSQLILVRIVFRSSGRARRSLGDDMHLSNKGKTRRKVT